MSLSRKRTKEIKRLKKEAAKLWSSQQDLIGQANAVAKNAGNQLNNYSREHVVPTVIDTYENRVAPVLSRGRNVVGAAVKGFDKTVVPAVGGAIGTVLSIGDVANDKRVRAAINRVQGKVTPPKKSSGSSVAKIIGIGLGVIAVGSIAYALWQTFRADDELWVADDEASLPNT